MAIIEGQQNSDHLWEGDPVVGSLASALQTLQTEVASRQFISVDYKGRRYRTTRAAKLLMRCVWKLQEEFRIPDYDLPFLCIPDNESFDTDDVHEGYFDPTLNILYIPEQAWRGNAGDRFQLGDRIGEELFGHCYRLHHLFKFATKPSGRYSQGGKAERGDVEEFYGYLGRKAFLRMLADRGAAELFFPKGFVTPPRDPAVIEGEIQTLRKRLADWFVPDRNRIATEIVDKEKHSAGYNRALSVNIDEMPWKDVSDLFSLSTEEAAQRFFGGRTSVS